MKEIYAACWNWRRPQITKFQVTKETDKTLTVGRGEAQLGSLIYSRSFRKTSVNHKLFDTLSDALQWLYDLSNEKMAAVIAERDLIEEERAGLARCLAAAKEKEL